jgi:DNA-binding GntR family transcriptional regulator
MSDLLNSVLAAKEALKTPPLATRVGQFVEDLIFEGKLGPGIRIIEEELSEALGVSRTSLREAMLGLEQSGIIERGKRGGRYIRNMTKDDLHDLYEGWAIVESEAAALACQDATAKHHRMLQSLIEEMDLAADLQAFHRLNLEFHAALVAPCTNQWLKTVYEGCLKNIRFAWALAVAWSGAREQSQAEHWQILDAYRAGDAERTHSLVRRHLSAGAEKITLGGDDHSKEAAVTQRERRRKYRTPDLA